jgi:hypothetical protein
MCFFPDNAERQLFRIFLGHRQQKIAEEGRTLNGLKFSSIQAFRTPFWHISKSHKKFGNKTKKSKRFYFNGFAWNCGDKRDRTADLLNAIA